MTSLRYITHPCRKSVKTVRLLDQTKVTRYTAAATRLVTLARRTYSTEPLKDPSKFAQALQSQNQSAVHSTKSPTPSAAAALGIAPDGNDMAPPRRGAKEGAKPNVGKDGKPISDVPRPSAS